MGMILRIASSRIVGQGDIVGRSGYFSLNLSANSVMRGRLDARRTLKSLVADLRDTFSQAGCYPSNKCATDFTSHFLCQYISGNTARTNDCSQFGYIFKSCLLLLIQVCPLFSCCE